MIADFPNGKVIFVHIPRTSGTSIESCITCVPLEKKHLRASQLKNAVGSAWGRAYKFTFVRNPFDRLISIFHAPYYKDINILSGKNLDFFLDNYFLPSWEHGYTQHDYIDENIDEIFFFEKRSQEVEYLNTKLSIFCIKVDSSKKLGVIKRPAEYRGFYNATTRKRVETLFEDDLNRFGYDF